MEAEKKKIILWYATVSLYKTKLISGIFMINFGAGKIEKKEEVNKTKTKKTIVIRC